MESEVICIDSCVLIDYYRAKEKSNTLFVQLSREGKKFAFSSIVIYEVLRGQHNDFFDKLFSHPDTQILSFDYQTARIASDIYLQLRNKNQGKKLDAALIDDILIAASSIQHNLPLSTTNSKHFEKIEGLTLYSLQ